MPSGNVTVSGDFDFVFVRWDLLRDFLVAAGVDCLRLVGFAWGAAAGVACLRLVVLPRFDFFLATVSASPLASPLTSSSTLASAFCACLRTFLALRLLCMRS